MRRTLLVLVALLLALTPLTLLAYGEPPAGTSSVSVQVKTTDIMGNPRTEFRVGFTILITGELVSQLDVDQQVAFVVQVKDSSGRVVKPGVLYSLITLKAGAASTMGISFMPLEPGEYVAEVYVWSSISEPVPLAPPAQVSFTVTA
jgi:hypothetical protein